MPKRMTDTGKWNKQFLRGLKATLKLLWLYILDECDHCGIWQFDGEIAQIKIGEKIDFDEAIKAFEGRVYVIDNGSKWFIPSFIEFQNPGGLNEKNRAHLSIIFTLKKYNLLNDNNEIKPLASPLERGYNTNTNNNIGTIVNKEGGETKTVNQESQGPKPQKTKGKRTSSTLTAFEDSRVYDRSIWDAECPAEWTQGDKDYWWNQADQSSNRGNKYTDWIKSVKKWKSDNEKQNQKGTINSPNGYGIRPMTSNQKLNQISGHGGHLKIDENKWVRIAGSMIDGHFKLDPDNGDMVMYCAGKSIRVTPGVPGTPWVTNVMYELAPGKTIEGVYQYLLEQNKLNKTG